MMPADLKYVNNVLNCCKDDETDVTKLLNSTSVVNPDPEADTEPVNGPASITVPCDGEKYDEVVENDDEIACDAVDAKDAVCAIVA